VALNFVNGDAITFGVVYQAGPAMGVTNTQTYDNLDFNLTTTPLPATLPLFASDLGAMGFISRRRKRRNPARLATA